MYVHIMIPGADQWLYLTDPSFMFNQVRIFYSIWLKTCSAWLVCFVRLLYSSPSLIRSPYLPKYSSHIREVAFGGGRGKCIHSSIAATFSCHIREGILSWDWPLREGHCTRYYVQCSSIYINGHEILFVKYFGSSCMIHHVQTNVHVSSRQHKLYLELMILQIKAGNKYMYMLHVQIYMYKCEAE